MKLTLLPEVNFSTGLGTRLALAPATLTIAPGGLFITMLCDGGGLAVVTVLMGGATALETIFLVAGLRR